jgi:hypothetical protein
VPVILTTQEAEIIRRIAVQSQPQANSSQHPLLKKKKKKTLTKRADGVVQGVGPEFKPQHWKKIFCICMQ